MTAPLADLPPIPAPHPSGPAAGASPTASVAASAADAPPDDARLHWPSAERNQGPILAVLQRVLPAQGRLLEIASGSGQHAAHCAAGLPGWQWQPTEPDAASHASIAAWAAHAAGQSSPGRVLPVVALDLLDQPWPDLPALAGPFDALFNANMLHISPWATCAALMRHAARLLTADGHLVTYGPYLETEVTTSPGNLAFDADLRARNPAWGIRWRHDVEAEAAAHGLVLAERVAMPANNLMLVFRRAA